MAEQSEPEFFIRPIRPSDNPAVAQVIRTVMTEFGAVGPGYSIEDPEVDAMYEAYAGPRAAYFVLESAGKVVGCGGVAPLQGGDPDTCELKKMYFMPEARGLGWGRRLVEKLEDQARRIGFRYMYLETISAMQQANRLYRTAGFTALPGPMGHTGHSACGLFYGKVLSAAGFSAPDAALPDDSV